VRRATGSTVAVAVLMTTALGLGCVYGRSAPAEDKVAPELVAVAEAPAITVSDTLERLIEEDRATRYDREYAYWNIRHRAFPRTADEAFARAAVAGRVAELRGLNAGAQVREAEHYARMSARMDGTFRRGSAQRMLGTLYIFAPSYLVQHGDSELGLELLLELAERYPEDPETHLRVGEAYVELGDPGPSPPHLCLADAHRETLRADEQALLVRLMSAAGLESCPR